MQLLVLRLLVPPPPPATPPVPCVLLTQLGATRCRLLRRSERASPMRPGPRRTRRPSPLLLPPLPSCAPLCCLCRWEPTCSLAD